MRHIYEFHNYPISEEMLLKARYPSMEDGPMWVGRAKKG
jgi:hypothetical protein